MRRDGFAFATSPSAFCPGMVFDFESTGRASLQHSCFLCSSQARRLEDEVEERYLRDLVSTADLA